MWHMPCQRCKYTTSVDIQKTCYKKIVTHVELHASTVSLLESGEQHNMKAIIIIMSNYIFTVKVSEDAYDQNDCFYYIFLTDDSLPTKVVQGVQ